MTIQDGGSQSWKGWLWRSDRNPKRRDLLPHKAVQSRSAALLGTKEEREKEKEEEGRGWRYRSRRVEMLRTLLWGPYDPGNQRWWPTGIACSFLPSWGLYWGFPGGSVVKHPPTNAGDMSSIPGSGRSPAGGNGNPLQYSCLENSMDKGAWRATVHRVTKSQTRLRD